MKQALLLTKDIRYAEFARRFLDLPEMTRLKHNINRLKEVTSEPAKGLLNILNFEYQAVMQSVRNHQTTLGLSRVIKHTPSPAVIIMISQQNHDAEALLIAADSLSKQGYTVMPMIPYSTNVRDREISSRRGLLCRGNS